jgi:hypothetical protein
MRNCIPVSQAIISVKAKNLYHDLKKQMGEVPKISNYFLQAMVGFIGVLEFTYLTPRHNTPCHTQWGRFSSTHLDHTWCSMEWSGME